MNKATPIKVIYLFTTRNQFSLFLSKLIISRQLLSPCLAHSVHSFSVFFLQLSQFRGQSHNTPSEYNGNISAKKPYFYEQFWKLKTTGSDFFEINVVPRFAVTNSWIVY